LHNPLQKLTVTLRPVVQRLESAFRWEGPTAKGWWTLTSDTPSTRRPYTAPAIRDLGDLVELTATVGGGLSDVPQGAPIGTGCQVVTDCFS